MHARLLASPRLTTLLLILIVAAVGIGLSGIVVSAHSPGDVERVNGELRTSNRDGLSICIESLVSDTGSQELQGHVRGAMNAVTHHPQFAAEGLAAGPTTVEIDCPGEPTIFSPGYNPQSKLGYPFMVDSPSPYRTFVYLISEADALESFSSQPPRTVDPARPLRITTQEVFCEGEICPEVTVALYLTPRDLRDAQYLQYSLTHAVGLRPEDEVEVTVPLPIDPLHK